MQGTRNNRIKKILCIIGGVTIVGGLIVGVALLASGVRAGAGAAVLAADVSFKAMVGGGTAAGVTPAGIAIGLSSGVGAVLLKKGKQVKCKDEGN